jgi:hypothetical protein
LEKVCNAVPKHDKKTILGDFKAKVGKESYLHPASNGTNDDGDLARQELGIKIRTLTRSPGNHLTTKYVTR